MNGENSGSRNFAIALSFPGEHRRFVKRVATCLAEVFGRKRVFFDEWHQELIIGARADLKLKSIYRSQSLLVIPFFSVHYEKMWCQVEWDAIRVVLAERRKDDAVIPVHLDKTRIEGWERIDMGIRRGRKTAREVAEQILKCYEVRDLPRAQPDQSCSTEDDSDFSVPEGERRYNEGLDSVARYFYDVFKSLESDDCQQQVANAIGLQLDSDADRIRLEIRKCFDLSRLSDEQASEWWQRTMEEFDVIGRRFGKDDAMRMQDLADIISILGIPSRSLFSVMEQLEAGSIVENDAVTSHVMAELVASFADHRQPRFIQGVEHEPQGEGLLILSDLSTIDANVEAQVVELLNELAGKMSVELPWDESLLSIEDKIRKSAKYFGEHRALTFFATRHHRRGELANGRSRGTIRFYCVIAPPLVQSQYKRLIDLIDIVNTEISALTFFVLQENNRPNTTEHYFLQRITNRRQLEE